MGTALAFVIVLAVILIPLLAPSYVIAPLVARRAIHVVSKKHKLKALRYQIPPCPWQIKHSSACFESIVGGNHFRRMPDNDWRVVLTESNEAKDWPAFATDLSTYARFLAWLFNIFHLIANSKEQGRIERETCRFTEELAELLLAQKPTWAFRHP